MAKAQFLTSYQRGIVRRYYQNRGSLMLQKLAETVSELALCADEKKKAKLWQTAETALRNSEVPPEVIAKVVGGRKLEDLAALVGELQ